MKFLARSALLALAALGAALPRCATAALVPANVTTTGSSVTTNVLSDQSTVVKFLADGTFTVPAGATARLLLVGGGGGGGAECGGGGGAGGFVEASDVVLAPGTYTVTVGARGEGGNTALNGGIKQGGNGGNTVLSFGGTDLYTAVGGGGGGVWQNGAGSAGGSGGGGGNTSGVGGTGTEGQGFAGGAKGGGGGGAGGPGGNGAGGKNTGTNGAGGPGKASDITGEQVYYAGGGGGGGYNDNPGAGGIGGGGNGMRTGNESTRIARSQAEFDAEAGVDGLGGGGGGGNNTGSYYGRPGGSGVLIVRLAPAGPEPQIRMLGATDGPASVVVKMRLVSVGDGASSASFSYKVANSAAGLDTAAPVAAASGVAAGATVSIRLSNLTPGGTTYVRILAENNLGVDSAPVDTTVHPHSCYATFTVAEYAGSTALANFPVLVRLSSSSPSGFSYEDCAQDGSDIRFVDSDGNLVPHEIDTWNREGESLIWVGLPVMNAGTTFTMYYGSIASSGATAEGSVWARYAVVIHGGDSLANAVSGGVAVSAGSTAVSATAGSGVVGGGVNKSTANAKGVNVVNPAKAGALANNNAFSLSGWFKRTGSGTAILAGSRTSWNSQNGFLWLQEGSDRISVAANNSHQLTTNNKKLLSTDSWTHLAFTVDDTVELKSYFNGAPDQAKASPATLLNTSNAYWTFGSYCDTASDDSYAGDMDELRIFDGVASGDWIQAEHDTVASATFLSADAAVHAGASAAPVVGLVASSVEYTNATFSATIGSLGMDAGMTTDATWADLLLVVGTEETLSSPAFAVPLSRATEAPAHVSASLAGLSADTVYYAQLRATNSLGVAGESRVAAFTTLPPGPAFTVEIDSDHLVPEITLSFTRTGLGSAVTRITVEVSASDDFSNIALSKTYTVNLAEMPTNVNDIVLTGFPTASPLYYRVTAENTGRYSRTVEQSASSTLAEGDNVWSGLSEDIDDPNAYVFEGGLPAPDKTLYFTKPAGLSPVIDRDVDMPSLRFTNGKNESVDTAYLGGYHSCGYNLSGSGVLTFTAEKPIVQASYGTNTISNPIRFSRSNTQTVTITSVGEDKAWLHLNGSLLLPAGVSNTTMSVTGRGNTVLGGPSPDFMGELSVPGGRLTFASPNAMTNVSKISFSGDPTSMSNAIGAPLVFPRVSSTWVSSGWGGRKLHVYGAPFVFPQATFEWAIRDYEQSMFEADWVVSNVVVRKNESNGDACLGKIGAGAFIVKGETTWYNSSVKSYIRLFRGCFWPQTAAGLPPSGEFYIPNDHAWRSTLGLSGDFSPMLDGSSTPRFFQSSSLASWGFTGFGGERTVCWNADPTLNLTNTTDKIAVTIPLGDASHTNVAGKAYSDYYAYPARFMFGNRSEFADGTILFLNPIRYEFGQDWDACTYFESTNHVVAARLRGSLKLGTSGKTWHFSGNSFGGYLALEADNSDFTGRVNVREKGNLLVNSNLVARSVTVQSGSGLGGTGSLSALDGMTVKSGGALFGGEWNKGGVLTLGGKLTFESGSALRVEVGASNDRIGCVKLAPGATLKLGSPVYVDVDTDPRVSPVRGMSRKILDWSEASFDAGAPPARENFVARPASNSDIETIYIFTRDDGLYVNYLTVRYPQPTMLLLR